MAEADLSRRGLQAWDALLRAHATLMRQLETDLERKTGLALADFDVLAQLASAGGALRMTELADRALISRSGMTRRSVGLFVKAWFVAPPPMATRVAWWSCSPRPVRAAWPNRLPSTCAGSPIYSSRN